MGNITPLVFDLVREHLLLSEEARTIHVIVLDYSESLAQLQEQTLSIH